ncbi:MAG: glycosyltransferase family 39 protein [Pyrinomonadaceae bacterium]
MRSRPAQFAATIVLAVLYIALRCWHLTDSCLWFDEIFGVHAAQHPWGEMFGFVALDLIHPPLFYVLLKLWVAIGGESLLWLRSFPVVFAVAALFPFLSLCRELKLDPQTRMFALFLITVNGSLIKYSQEVRMYSLLMCLSLFSIWLFTRYFIKGKSFVPLLIVNILLVYTHYFGWFLIVTEVAAILLLQRIKWRAMIKMFAITLAAFLPWLLVIYNASRTGVTVAQNIGWMQRPGMAAISLLKLALIEPFYFQASNVDPFSIYRVTIPLILIFLVAIILFATAWSERSVKEVRSVFLLLSFTVIPVLGALVFSWTLPYSVWGARHLIFVFAPSSLLFAIVIFNIPNRSIRTAALTLILLFSGYALVLQSGRQTSQYAWCAWEPLVAQIDQTQPIKILAFEDLVAYHLWFATRNNPAVTVFKVEGVDGVNEDKAYFLPRGFDGVERKDLKDLPASEYWLALRVSEWDLNQPPLTSLSENGFRFGTPKIFPSEFSKQVLVDAMR